MIHTLQAAGELVEVRAPVDAHLELAEIHRRVVQQGGPALLFSTIKGCSYQVATNLFGSERRIRLALGEDVESRITQILSLFLDHGSSRISLLWKHRKAMRSLLNCGTRRVRTNPFLKSDVPDLGKLPFITCWPTDGGPYLTLPLVYTQSPVSFTPNLGMYRIQRHSSCETGVHWQVGKGGGFHYQQAELSNAELPLTVYLGGSTALLFSAIAPLPEQISELIFASLLQGEKIGYVQHPATPLPLLVDCEMALCGTVRPFVRRLEGPFGDHFGYNDPARPFPVFTVKHIFSRPNAIIPATVTGKPLQEDAILGTWVQRLLKPFLLTVVPGIEDVHSFPETGFHPLVAIRVKERYHHEAFSVALRLLSEGQLSFTKVLLVVDDRTPLDDISTLLPFLLERLSPQQLHIFSSTINDSLDMTGPAVDSGSKLILFGIGPPKRRLPHLPPSNPPCATAIPFVPGCLVIDGVSSKENLTQFIKNGAFTSWPLVIIVDDAKACTSSSLEFLWTVFTRFEPGRDIYAKDVAPSRNSLSFTPPLLIDARMKPAYYPELHPSEETVDLVNRRWHEYFPS